MLMDLSSEIIHSLLPMFLVSVRLQVDHGSPVVDQHVAWGRRIVSETLFP
jgi:hypothetical protein